MHRLASVRGNAIILALICIVLVGGLAAVTFSRAASSEQRSAQTKVKSRAELSADAALQMAIAKVQRVGSSTSNETNCSLLDGPNPDVDPVTNPAAAPCDAHGNKVPVPDVNKNLNGATDEDGRYWWEVRNDGDYTTLNPDDAADRKRLKTRVVTAVGQYKGETRTRQIKFQIVPRAFRYALFAKGLDSGEAVEVSDGARLFLPPPYADVRQGRGGNLGADNDVVFQPGAQVNKRNTDGEAEALYDRLFKPSGANATNDPTEYFNDSGDARRKNPWGAITVGPDNCGATATCAGMGQASATVAADLDGDGTIQAGETKLQDFKDTPSASDAIFFDGNGDNDGIQQLATATALPEYAGWMTRQFKNVDAGQNTSDPNPYWDGDSVEIDADGLTNGTVYTPDDFQKIVSSSSAVTFNGPVYVDGHFSDPDGACYGSDPIRITTDVTFAQGSLIVDGCDVEVASGASVRIIHSTKDKDATVGDPTAGLGVHERPAILIKRNGEDHGGNFTSLASDTASVNVDGLVYVDGDLTIRADRANPSGNFVNNGAVVVRGKFSAAGTSGGKVNVVLRWNPVVQQVEFDPTNDRMGTYSIRTNDQPPPDAPRVTNFRTPADGYYKDRDGDGTPEYPEPEVSFSWDIDGPYDTVECRWDKQASTADPSWVTGAWRECGPNGFVNDGAGGRPAPIDEADTNIKYRFQVRVCNAAGCDYAPAGMEEWFQIPPRPDVTFTTTPSDPTVGRDATFSWTVDKPISRMECRIDGGPWANCGDLVARTGTYNFTNPVNGLNYGTHTFEVRVENYSGDRTRSHTWTNEPPPAPTVTITGGPNGPVAYNATTQSFTFTTSGMLGTNVNGSVQCQLERRGYGQSSYTVYQAFSSCSSPKTYTGLPNDSDYIFTVRVSNDGGTDSATRNFRVRMPPPSISWVNLPVNPSPYYANSYVRWSVTPSHGITSQQCAIDNLDPGWYRYWGWANCSSPSNWGNLPHNGGYWGNAYRLYVQVCNESGCNNQSGYPYNWYDWRIYPDPPSIWWRSYPGHVDYGAGSSWGSYYTGGGPGEYLCHDARGWVGCEAYYGGWGAHNFWAHGYCSDTVVSLATRNATTSWAQSNNASFHRNCSPPVLSIWWSSIGWGDGWVAAYYNYHPYQCAIWNSGGWQWWGPGGCFPNPVRPMPQSSYVCYQSWSAAPDWSRTAYATAGWANYWGVLGPC